MKVKIRSSSAINRIEYTGEDTPLGIYIKAAPEKGKANHQMLKLLAITLQIPTADIRIVTGYASRHKTILIRGLSSAEVIRKLERPCSN